MSGCFHPQTIRLPDGRSQVVRCGKCLSCLEHRQAGWIARLTDEFNSYPDGIYFVTLTYDDEHVPMKDVGNGVKLPAISSTDVMKFHADLRKRFQQGFYYDRTLSDAGWADLPTRISLPECHFKYYVTAEYGPNGTRRPHYHGFYSNMLEDEDLVFDLFQSVWGKGFVTVEKGRSEACAAYVSKYLVNDSLVPYDHRLPKPRAWISKGLGKYYLDDPRTLEFHRCAPLAHQYVMQNGRIGILPRYWRDKIYDDEMKAVILDDCVKRDEASYLRFDALSDEESAKVRLKEKERQDEAYRQAEWHFRKRNKIK